MKVLWLCNLVLSDFSEVYHIKKRNFGGWMSGLLTQLQFRNDIQLGMCFPIVDETRMLKGSLNGCKYYSFHAQFNHHSYDPALLDEFEAVIEDFTPDLIHIWGTEYAHSWAMIELCKNIGMINRVVVHVQGLVSIVAEHYLVGIDRKYINLKISKYKTFIEEQQNYFQRGKSEIHALKKLKYISGRTEWDKLCVKQIQPKVNYLFCHEMLRLSFYENKFKWSYTNCNKNTIFVSQGSYPIKGLHILLKAINNVCKNFPDVKVYVSGYSVISEDKNGELSPYGILVKDLIKENQLEGKIDFLGVLNEEQMIEQYLKANVFVSASTIENSSNSVCEAMFLGTPVIASYVGGIPSLIEHRYDGLLYQHDAYYMLAGYICELFADEKLANTLSLNAIKRAAIRHNVNSIVESTINMYEKIVCRDS